MTPEQELTPLQRRAHVLERLDEGHKDLHASLEGLDPVDAFLGSRWSVWEVLNHLDTEKFVAALEQIVAGDKDMLPPFNTREVPTVPQVGGELDRGNDVPAGDGAPP